MKRRYLQAGLATAYLLCACSCGGSEQGDPAPRDGGGPPPLSAGPLFAEITSDAGLPGPQASWPDGTYDLTEFMQGGLALFDYDLDEDLDLLHLQMPPPGRPNAPAADRLYRQDDDGTFVDVSAESGLTDPGRGQGVAIGDTDNDGDPDVYITRHGPDAFYVNNGDGTFTEAAGAAGFSGDRWSTSATFCDYDRDGFLDLYVVHYVRNDPDTVCLDEAERREYCGPQVFHGVPDVLYRNRGDGTFEDVTEAAGIVLPEGGRRARGLGVVCLDLTGDTWPDFYVANDGESNQLWSNRGDGTFAEEAIFRGVAVAGSGEPQASMGITFGDPNRDGLADLYMTHLWKDYNTLYLSGSRHLYSDRTRRARLGMLDVEFTGFGCGFFDFDHDGDHDLAVANGAVRRRPKHPRADIEGFWRDYAEPNHLFVNTGDGTFESVAGDVEEFTRPVEVSRALAFGDIDDDGDVDIVVSNADNTLRLYRNDAPRAGTHWLRVRALTGSRDAIGAEIFVETSGGTLSGESTLRGWIQPGYSYLASNDLRAHFGLGGAARVEGIVVQWPDGTKERFPAGEADRQVTVIQGTGQQS